MSSDFRHSSFLEERPAELSEDLFERIFHSAEIANMTPEEFLQYQSKMLASFDLLAQKDYAFEYGQKVERAAIYRKLEKSGMDPEQIQDIMGPVQLEGLDEVD